MAKLSEIISQPTGPHMRGSRYIVNVVICSAKFHTKAAFNPAMGRQRAPSVLTPDVPSAETVPKTPGHTDTMHGSRTANARNSFQNSSAVPTQTKTPGLPAVKVFETLSRTFLHREPRIGLHDGQCALYLEPPSAHCCDTRIGEGTSFLQ